MKIYPRVYTELLKKHLSENRQMAFMSGPRQVGKTTVCRGLADVCLNWDNQDECALILKGPAAVASFAELQKLHAPKRIVAFDEIHRYTRWKTFLKGFFDVYGETVGTVVTASARGAAPTFPTARTGEASAKSERRGSADAFTTCSV